MFDFILISILKIVGVLFAIGFLVLLFIAVWNIWKVDKDD